MYDSSEVFGSLHAIVDQATREHIFKISAIAQEKHPASGGTPAANMNAFNARALGSIPHRPQNGQHTASAHPRLNFRFTAKLNPL